MECKQTMVSQNTYIADSRLWSSCSGGKFLNVVASNLLRTRFKSQSLSNSIIFITEHHLPDPLQSAQIHETATKICLNPTTDFKDATYPIIFGP